MSLEVARKRVREEGVPFLNRVWAGWRNLLAPETLDIRNPQACVLGQLDGNYYKGMETLGLDYDGTKTLGFLATEDATYPELTRAWQEVAEEAGELVGV